MPKSPRTPLVRPVKIEKKKVPRVTVKRDETTPPFVHKPRSSLQRKELKYYGTAACLALWQRRPDDVIRIYLQTDLVEHFKSMLKWAAARRLAYHIVEAEDLERLTESVHHQGICVLARDAPEFSFKQLGTHCESKAQIALIYLDGVSNPHNLGAILRVAAHFGIDHVLAPRGSARVSPSACRVAEGGAEFVNMVYLNDPHADLTELRKLGFRLIGADTRGGESIFTTSLSARTVLMMGGEEHGLSSMARSLADKIVSISGTGRVESLNVAAASAILAAEFTRQHPSIRENP